MVRLSFLAALLLYTSPVQAQQFWHSPDFSGAAVAPGEAGIGVALPNATPEEERANLAWQMRAALNVAALQCQFDRTLLSQDIYNGILTNHRVELANTYNVLSNYFRRTSKTLKAGQDALDRYGTKTYIGVSTVRGILGFCETTSRVGSTALFVPAGGFTVFAIDRLREVRNSLAAARDLQFARGIAVSSNVALPNFDSKCWRRDQYISKCGYSYLAS